MKPLYILLLLYALFITALADGLEMGFLAIPVVGIVIGLAVSFCINVTMGAGLIFLLISDGMFHPKFGPAGVIASFIPGLNALPFWIAVVGAGILQKMGEEDAGALGMMARITSSLNPMSLANPLAAGGVTGTVLKAAQSLPQRKDVSAQPTAPGQELNGAKSPRIALTDIKTSKPTGTSNTPAYVQKAA